MIKLLLASAVLISSSASFADDLPRRGVLGVGLQAGQNGGAVIVSEPEGAALAAGLQQGDEVLSINDVALSGPGGFGAFVSAMEAGVPNTVTLLRDGEQLSLEFIADSMPLQSLPGASAQYGHVTLENGDRIRTITLTPDQSALANEDGLPAVFYIQGIPCAPIDGFANHQMFRNRLFIDLIEAGFVVSIADKPGIGDSEGIACVEGGFDREVEAFTLAATALSEQDGIDPSRIYSVGVSMGGIQAPLVSENVDIAGIVTWGTGVSPWFGYTTENFRMRSMMQGQPADTGDEFMRLVRSIFVDLILERQTPTEIRAARPEDAVRFESQMGSIDYFAGRHYTFHQEIDAVNGWGAWQQFEGRLLALQGEFDWVASEHDHRMAVEIVNAANPGHAAFEIVPGLDHGFTAHESREDSFANAFSGQPSDGFHDRAVEWLTALASE